MDVLSFLVNSTMILRFRLSDVFVLLRHFCEPDLVCKYLRVIALRFGSSVSFKVRYSKYLHKYVYSFQSDLPIIVESNDIVSDWFSNAHVVLKTEDAIAARSQLGEKFGDLLVSYYYTFYK